MGNHIFSIDTTRQLQLIIILEGVTTTGNLHGPWPMERPGEERVGIHLPQLGYLHLFQERITGASSSAELWSSAIHCWRHELFVVSNWELRCVASARLSILLQCCCTCILPLGVVLCRTHNYMKA
jgi:hypothetical protein